jgi:ComF family protein
MELLEFLECKSHCPKCFSSDFSQKNHGCKQCQQKKSPFTGIGATFDYKGPIVTLVKKLKYGNQAYLSTGISSFMAAQFVSLNWPLPDIIIPVPQSLSRMFTRGYNQAELLSETLSIFLKCPVQKALKRSSDDYSQAALNKDQRLRLTGNSIRLKKNQMLQDKVILLVDDVMTTGSTLQRCAEALLEECPNSIYALTACHTDIAR